VEGQYSAVLEKQAVEIKRLNEQKSFHIPADFDFINLVTHACILCITLRLIATLSSV
jgi:tRNA U34 5-carboxymethylaminomethyl modifying enzyme MnmG/GidA